MLDFQCPILYYVNTIDIGCASIKRYAIGLGQSFIYHASLELVKFSPEPLISYKFSVKFLNVSFLSLGIDLKCLLMRPYCMPAGQCILQHLKIPNILLETEAPAVIYLTILFTFQLYIFS